MMYSDWYWKYRDIYNMYMDIQMMLLWATGTATLLCLAIHFYELAQLYRSERLYRFPK